MVTPGGEAACASLLLSLADFVPAVSARQFLSLIEPGQHSLQGVHMLFEGMPDRPWKEGEKRTSKMVFIGKDLDAALLREGFEACRVKADGGTAA